MMLAMGTKRVLNKNFHQDEEYQAHTSRTDFIKDTLTGTSRKFPRCGELLHENCQNMLSLICCNGNQELVETVEI